MWCGCASRAAAFSPKRQTLTVRPAKPIIGIKPEFEGRHAGDAGSAAFQIIALDRDGKPAAMKGLNWELSRLERRFQWYNRDGRWDYETVQYVRKVANGSVDVAPGSRARVQTGARIRQLPSGSDRARSRSPARERQLLIRLVCLRNPVKRRIFST